MANDYSHLLTPLLSHVVYVHQSSRATASLMALCYQDGLTDILIDSPDNRINLFIRVIGSVGSIVGGSPRLRPDRRRADPRSVGTLARQEIGHARFESHFLQTRLQLQVKAKEIVVYK